MEAIVLTFFRRLLDDYIVTNSNKFNSQFDGTPSAKYLSCFCLMDKKNSHR